MFSSVRLPFSIKNLSQAFWLGLKLALIASAIILMIKLGVIAPSGLSLLLQQPLALVVMVLAFWFGAHLALMRWALLLKVLGITIPFWRLWQIYAVSYFFGNFLPGGLGGDAVRLVYLLREMKGQHQAQQNSLEATLSLVCDRLLGFIGLFLLALACAALIYTRVTASVTLALLLAFAVVITALLLLALPCSAFIFHKILPWLARYRFFAPEHAVGHFLHRVFAALAQYHRAPRTMMIGLMFSVLNHAALVFVMVWLVSKLGLPALLSPILSSPILSWPELSYAASWTILVNQLPLLPGGILVGEASFASLCAMLAPDNQSLAVLAGYGLVVFAFRLVTIVASLPGALVYLAFQHKAS